MDETEEVYKPGIPGISDVSVYPRRGKIRLGESMEERRKEGKDYPDELPHLGRIDGSEEDIKRYHELYGEEPQSIQIVFVSDDRDENWRQEFVRYEKGQKVCFGNGSIAFERSVTMKTDVEKRLSKLKGELLKKAQKRLSPDDYDYKNVQITCGGVNSDHYKKKKCGMQATMKFLILGMPGLKLWWIETGSKYSMKIINTMHDKIIKETRNEKYPDGRIRGIPLKLTREQKQFSLPGGIKTKKWVLSIDVEGMGVADLVRMGDPIAVQERAEEARKMLEGEVIDVTPADDIQEVEIVDDEENIPEAPTSEKPKDTEPIEAPEVSELEEVRMKLQAFLKEHHIHYKPLDKYALWHFKVSVKQMAAMDIKALVGKIKEHYFDKEGRATLEAIEAFHKECEACGENTKKGEDIPFD